MGREMYKAVCCVWQEEDASLVPAAGEAAFQFDGGAADKEPPPFRF